jgi:hypothetical protein
MGTKINKLIKMWQPGMVFTSSFLKNQGINYDQQSTYKKSGWLESMGFGAFKKEGDLIKWAGGLNAMQKQLKLKIHLGGKSALIKQGYSHYAYVKEPNLFLFMSRDNKLPGWFKNYEWGTKLELSRTELLPADLEESYTNTKIDGFDIMTSIPERSVLEMLYFVPTKQGFDEAIKIMEFMVSFRPEKVQMLLEYCTSVKVKRLFLYMAEKQDHFWYKELNLDKINLGSGNRMIVKNGILDTKFKITVPKENQK